MSPETEASAQSSLWNLAAITCLASLMFGCHSTSSFVGDQYYEEGRYPEAERALTEYLESSALDDTTAARALYRLGVIYAFPGSRLHDPEKAREVLDTLLSWYPDSAQVAEAKTLRDVLVELQEQQAERSDLMAQIATLQTELEASNAQLFTLQKQVAVKQGQITSLAESIPPLEARIRELVEQLAARQQELEQLDRLKAIDLESPPPRPRR